MTPEGRVKEMIRKEMEKAFPDAYRFTPVGCGYGAGGVPDLIYCVRGLFVGIEAKVVGNHPTGRQEVAHRAIRRAGGLVYVIHSLVEIKRAIVEVEMVLHSLYANDEDHDLD